MNHFVSPWCAVCERQVDSFTWTYDAAARAFYCTARCHGQEQKEILSQEMLYDALDVAQGRAFAVVPALANKQLEEEGQ